MKLHTWGSRQFAAALCLTLAVSTAWAQPEGGRGRRGGGGFGFGGGGFGQMSLIQLANNEAVQKDLELSKENAEKIKPLAEEAMKAQNEGIDFAAMRDASAEERTKMMEKRAENSKKAAATYDPKVSEILSADQVTRLKQISFRLGGAQAYTNPETAKALEITDEQKEKMAAVNKSFGEKMQEARGGSSEDRAAGFAKMQELNKSRDQDLEAILTDAQKAKLASLKGKDFDVSQLRGGFGGPGGGGGGRGRNPAGRPQTNN